MSESSPSTTKIINTISDLASTGSDASHASQSISSLLADCSFSSTSSPISSNLSSVLSPGAIGSSPRDYANSESNISDDYYSQIRSFLSNFNQRFDVSANSLTDVINLVNGLLSKKSKPFMKDADKQLSKIKEENEKIKAENDKLTITITDMKTKMSTLEYENTKLKQSYESLDSSYKCLQEEAKGYQANIVSMQEEWEGQISDLKSLGKQRNDLYRVANKQMQVIQKLESTIKSKEKELATKKVVEKKVEKVDNSDEIYSLLCSMVHVVEDEGKNDMKNEIMQCRVIRDESRTGVKERMLSLTKYLVDQIKENAENAKSIAKDLEEANKKVEFYHSKCGEVLTLFESELDFLQKLTHSADLQSTIFFQEKTGSSFVLTDDNKATLIRKCANLGKFVEETIGVLSQEKFNETFSAPESVDSNRIFDLLGAGRMENALEDVMSKIDKETDIDIREVFDLFTAQMFMNTLLKNHVTELHLRIAQYGHEIATLRQQNSEADVEAIREINDKLSKCEQKFEKIRKFLSQFVEVDDKTPTLKLIKKALVAVQNAAKPQESGEGNKSLKDELQRISSEKEKKEKELQKEKLMKDKIGKKLIIQAEKTKKQLVASQQELASIKEKCVKLSNDVESLKQVITEKNQENEDLKQQIEVSTKESEEKIKELSEKNESNESQIEVLNQKISENEKLIASSKKQKQALAKKIDSLQKSKQSLKEEAETKTNAIKENYTSILSDIQVKYKNALTELESRQNEIQEVDSKNQQLNSEIKQMRVEKRTLEMRIKSMEQKLDLDQQNIQSRISAQITAAQIEQSSRINALININEEAYHSICALLPQEVTPSDLQNAIQFLEKDYASMKQAQHQYMDLLDDANECQKLLNVGNDVRLSNALKEFIAAKNEKSAENAEKEKKWKRGQDECEKMRKEMRRTDAQLAELKKWDSWARRNHRVIHEAESVNLSSDELRLTLEEALLASIQHKSVFYRIDSLRAQKDFLVKYDKRVLNTHPITKPSIRSVLIVALAARRVMKMGGILPLNVLEQPPPITQETPRNSRRSSSRSTRETPKRKTEKETPRSSRRCASPKKPLYPVLI